MIIKIVLFTSLLSWFFLSFQMMRLSGGWTVITVVSPPPVSIDLFFEYMILHTVCSLPYDINLFFTPEKCPFYGTFFGVLRKKAAWVRITSCYEMERVINGIHNRVFSAAIMWVPLSYQYGLWFNQGDCCAFWGRFSHLVKRDQYLTWLIGLECDVCWASIFHSNKPL